MMPKIWIFSRWIDVMVLGLPVWLAWLACAAMPAEWLDQPLPLWMWVVFVLGIDVSHVWSTIFRTYLDPEEFVRHQKVLIITPLLVFLGLFVVASWSVLWFWRVMAYLALHHFIKQQYGFLAIYRAKYGVKYTKILSDNFIIYFSMLYPVIFWHLDSKRQFNWFYKNDFFPIHQLVPQLSGILLIINYLYWFLIGAWLLEELWRTAQNRQKWAWGKVLWVLTTAGNWYLGIVYFNSDVAFTLTNVIAHGVPYLALVFFYVERKKQIKLGQIPTHWAKITGSIALMLAVVVGLALVEEYFWDLWLNREKQAFFEQFAKYPIPMLQNSYWQAAAFALLSVPQVSHYIIDGYIWKGGRKNPDLKAIFAK
ncbi:MAG: hypothetical protein MUE85_17905 [Microscillaceae bacterium]|nr:hypothetical protein [Microscillaceae bacterium]